MINLPPEIKYNPDFFNPVDLEDAKRIVLGHGISETPGKWEIETDWNCKLFKTRKFLNKDSIVLDWGVGIGRLSKMIIDTFGCKVVGVDINSKMLGYATDFVGSDLFSTMTVEEFKTTNTTKFTNAIAVWALQHSIDPVSDIITIKNSLTLDAEIFVFEERGSCIPIASTDQTISTPWFLIYRSNFHKLEKQFRVIEHGKFPRILNIPENNLTWWGFFKNK